MSFIDLPRLLAKANADPEFQLHSRLWNARIALRCYPEDQRDSVDELRITVSESSVFATEQTAPADARADVAISAPAADWDALLAPLPKPFFHDLRAACAHHGFTLEGERLHTAAFYPAIRRLIDLLREVRNATH